MDGEKLIVSESNDGYLVLREGRFRALHEGIEYRMIWLNDRGPVAISRWPEIVRLVEPA